MSNSPTPAPSFTLKTARLQRWIVITGLTIGVLLVLLDVFFNRGNLLDFSQVRRLSNIAREDGIATWFSSTLILLTALTLWAAYIVLRGEGTSPWRARGWGLIALFFTYMAADDASKIHERLGSVAKTLMGGESIGWFPSYSWQAVFLPFFGAMGIFILIFVWRECSERGSRALLIAALTCYALAVGLDFIEGLDMGYDEIAEWFSKDPDVFDHYARSCEEFLEMFGTTLFLAAFAGNLGRVWGKRELHFE